GVKSALSSLHTERAGTGICPSLLSSLHPGYRNARSIIIGRKTPMNAQAQDIKAEQDKPKKPGLNLGMIYQRWKLRLLIHRQIISTTLAALFGVLLALYHHADIDIYLIATEWLI